MSSSSDRFFLDVISGRRRGVLAAAARLGLALTEPAYAAITALRNLGYDHRLFPIRHLPRPTISVGNITTGGTGKTPVVCWLAKALRNRDYHPAVLMRGYKSIHGVSDERMLIAQSVSKLTVIANADRVRGAAEALAADAEIDLFILDDAMQHRRVWRDANLVLVNATEPWGHGHLLPRGLLRESTRGLKRADAVILTHSSEIPRNELAAIEATIHLHGGPSAIFHADHVLEGFSSNSGDLPMAALTDCPYFAACGIAEPEGYLAALQSHGKRCLGHHFFGDHHHFANDDALTLISHAASLGASAIVVTEKDWTKLSQLNAVRESKIAFWRVRLNIQFWNEDEEKLLELILRVTPS